MSHESRSQDRHPSKAKKPNNRDHDIAIGKEFENVIGDTIRKTVSEYHGLLRHGLNKELKEIVTNYEQATSGIKKPIGSGVKDQMIELVRQEVRQVFNASVSDNGSADTKHPWLKGANSQWTTDKTNPKANAQPDGEMAKHNQASQAEATSQHPPQGSSTQSQQEQASGHKYTVGNIPPYQYPMPQQNAEADQQTSVDETGQHNSSESKAQPKYHRYQMSDIPEYEPTFRHSTTETESANDSPVEERVQQENTYVEKRPSSNVGNSSNGITPPSSSFWVLPHGEDIQSPHSEVVKDSRTQENEQFQVPDHQKIEDDEGEVSYPEIYMLPQSSLEPLEQNSVVDSESEPIAYDALSATTASFLSIENADSDEEFPFFISEAEMAEEDIFLYVSDEDMEMEEDSVPYFLSEAELVAEDIQAEEKPEEEPKELAPTESALAAILEAVRDLKVVIHDSNQVVHIADQADDEPSKVEIYTSEEESSEQLAIASGELEEPAEVFEDPDMLEEAQVQDSISYADEDEEFEENSEAVVEELSQNISSEEDDSDENEIAEVTEAMASVQKESPSSVTELEPLAQTSEESEEGYDGLQKETLTPVAELDESSQTEDESEELAGQPQEEVITEVAEIEQPVLEEKVADEQLLESLNADEETEMTEESVSEEDDLIEAIEEDEELTEETVKKAVFEGTVRLNVEANGCIREIVHFVRELRQKPQLRLLRLVGNNRDGVDIWLGLREPLRLKSILPELQGITIVTKPLPHIGSPDERLLSVRLSRDSVFNAEDEMIPQQAESDAEQSEAEPVGAANP